MRFHSTASCNALVAMETRCSEVFPPGTFGLNCFFKIRSCCLLYNRVTLPVQVLKPPYPNSDCRDHTSVPMATPSECKLLSCLTVTQRSLPKRCTNSCLLPCALSDRAHTGNETSPTRTNALGETEWDRGHRGQRSHFLSWFGLRQIQEHLKMTHGLFVLLLRAHTGR